MSTDELDESPLAGRAAESGTVEDGDAEDVPDWLSFAAFAKGLSKKDKAGSSSLSADPIIPKRGEKDFEPANEQRYVALQTSLLDASRAALFTAVSSGTRSHSSKVHNRAVWDMTLQRAYIITVKDPALPNTPANVEATSTSAHGVHFLTMGRYHAKRKRMELLPEEALYLLERGTLECWTGEGKQSIPMTVQHAWSQMLHTGELNAERYHVYAWLRRLGYTVIRAEFPDSGPMPKTQLRHPDTASSSLGTALNALFRGLSSFPSEALRVLSVSLFPAFFTNAASRLQTYSQRGLLSLVGGVHWWSYDQLFSALQIVRTDLTSHSNKRSHRPYDVFFHVYKPVTKFKKTDPPEPDFRIGVINAETTPIPDFFDFERIFSQLPLEPVRASPQSRKPAMPSVWSRIASLFAHQTPKSGSLTRPAPYGRLKNGRKSAIIAVVDNGTISFQRFGDTDFSELPWLGGR